MQLWLGNYGFPVNGVKVTSERKIVRGKDNLPWKFVDEIQCDGFLEGAGQAVLTALQQSLMVALAVGGQDLIFRQDDGTPSATYLTNATSITGVVVTDGPNFQDTYGSEYATQRHFTFKAEADYRFPSAGSKTLTDFGETVEVSGGGPLYRTLPALFGPPQRQLIYEMTPVLASQRGFAVGAFAYPTPPVALWPFALTGSPNIVKKDPQKEGKSYTNYRIDWAYEFNWPLPLGGVPNRWPL